MAKQSFSVGQVLTAAQMTSLQQTAMLGGSATAKTASYTLVATDAGTVVSVNSTSATTITVNTGLFSAGDTVTIQNWGSGSVTITAGTATVNTAGSLIVPQYDGGVLYFTSASAAIYFDFVQAGAVSPLTTKGDLYTFASSDTRLGVGANNTVLTADSAEATGLKWAAPAGGAGNLALITSGTLSGTSVTISSLSDYTDIYVLLEDPSWSSGNSELLIRLNGSSSGNYRYNGFFHSGTNAFARFNTGAYSSVNLAPNGARNGAFGTNYAANFNNCKTPGYTKFETFTYHYTGGASVVDANFLQGVFEESAAVSTLTFTTSNNYTFAGGAYRIYGA